MRVYLGTTADELQEFMREGTLEIPEVYAPTPIYKRIAKLVQDYTKKEDRLFIIGGGWGGDVLFRAKRQGLSIWNTQFLEDSANLKKARELGFTKLVVVREPPLLVALQKTNPGGADYSGEPFFRSLSPITARWPPLYEDEQLMIREISPN